MVFLVDLLMLHAAVPASMLCKGESDCAVESTSSMVIPQGLDGDQAQIQFKVFRSFLSAHQTYQTASGKKLFFFYAGHTICG